jgi:hypothetical protein
VKGLIVCFGIRQLHRSETGVPPSKATGVSFVEVPEMSLAAIGQYIQDKNKPNR